MSSSRRAVVQGRARREHGGGQGIRRWHTSGTGEDGGCLCWKCSARTDRRPLQQQLEDTLTHSPCEGLGCSFTASTERVWDKIKVKKLVS